MLAYSRCRPLVSVLLGLIVFASGIACGLAEDPDAAGKRTNSTTAPSPPTISWDNGLHIHPRNTQAQLELGGEVQLDDRLFADSAAVAGVPSFTLRRGRLVVMGSGVKHLGFRITAESQKDGPFVLRDAYLSVDIAKRMQIWVGKSKPAIGLERNQSNRYLMLAERALPSDLAPDRDLGIQLRGEALGDKVTYMGGLFRGVPDGGSSDTSTNHGADGEFRVFVHPFCGAHASLLGGLGLGMGGSAGREKGSLPSFTTVGLAHFFAYRPGAIADGERTRISPQADYYWRSLGVMGEYAQSAQDVRLGNIVRRVSNTAWQASASYVLTGEKASITPAHSFNPAEHHWGAFELTSRFNSLQIDPRAYPILADPHSAAQKASGYQLGFNWYPQKYIKIVFNYAKTRFTEGAASGNRPRETVFIFRLQWCAY